MTSQATQIRARYGRMYALVTTLAAMAVVGTVWANTSGPQTGIDVSGMMSSTDTSRLPVQTIADAF